MSQLWKNMTSDELFELSKEFPNEIILMKTMKGEEHDDLKHLSNTKLTPETAFSLWFRGHCPWRKAFKLNRKMPPCPDYPWVGVIEKTEYGILPKRNARVRKPVKKSVHQTIPNFKQFWVSALSTGSRQNFDLYRTMKLAGQDGKYTWMFDFTTEWITRKTKKHVIRFPRWRMEEDGGMKLSVVKALSADEKKMVKDSLIYESESHMSGRPTGKVKRRFRKVDYADISDSNWKYGLKVIEDQKIKTGWTEKWYGGTDFAMCSKLLDRLSGYLDRYNIKWEPPTSRKRYRSMFPPVVYWEKYSAPHLMKQYGLLKKSKKRDLMWIVFQCRINAENVVNLQEKVKEASLKHKIRINHRKRKPAPIKSKGMAVDLIAGLKGLGATTTTAKRRPMKTKFDKTVNEIYGISPFPDDYDNWIRLNIKNIPVEVAQWSDSIGWEEIGDKRAEMIMDYDKSNPNRVILRGLWVHDMGPRGGAKDMNQDTLSRLLKKLDLKPDGATSWIIHASTEPLWEPNESLGNWLSPIPGPVFFFAGFRIANHRQRKPLIHSLDWEEGIVYWKKSGSDHPILGRDDITFDPSKPHGRLGGLISIPGTPQTIEVGIEENESGTGPDYFLAYSIFMPEDSEDIEHMEWLESQMRVYGFKLVRERSMLILRMPLTISNEEIAEIWKSHRYDWSNLSQTDQRKIGKISREWWMKWRREQVREDD